MPVTASDWSGWRDLNIWKYETLKFTIIDRCIICIQLLHTICHLDISDFLSSDKLVSHTKYNPYFSTKTLIQPHCPFQGFLGLKALYFYAERPYRNVWKFGLKYKNLNVLKGFVSLLVTHHFFASKLANVQIAVWNICTLHKFLVSPANDFWQHSKSSIFLI